jgi:hypothetical protein
MLLLIGLPDDGRVPGHVGERMDAGPTDSRSMRNSLRAALITLLAMTAPACLVVSLQPFYEADALTWDPALVGTWQSTDDETILDIEEDEWRSYRIQYRHPIETGELTGYLSTVDGERFLDVMPVRGTDRGVFVLPVHAVARLRVAEGRLELTPLSYDWFLDRARKGAPIGKLSVTIDQKQNAVIVSPPLLLRQWLQAQPKDGEMFGATTTFVRK